MAFATGYDFDVFISYARVDNQEVNLGGSDIRWVDYFRAQLERRVNQALGRNHSARFWFDRSDIARNQQFPDEIRHSIRKSALFLLLLSPGYVESNWCREELATFLKSAKDQGGVGDRLFVIRLRDLRSHERPSGLPKVEGYPFFDPEIPQAELSPKHPQFSQELFRLRENVVDTLKILKTDASDSIPEWEKEEMSNKPAVFLAETSPDLNSERKRLAAWIENQDHRVLPARFYNRAPNLFAEAAKRDFVAARLFVQLLGPNPTTPADDLPRGYEGLQFDLASDLPMIRAYFRDHFELENLEEHVQQLLTAEGVIATTPAELEIMIVDRLREFQLREQVDAPVVNLGAESGNIFVHAPRRDAEVATDFCLTRVPKDISYMIVEDHEPAEELAKCDDPDGHLVFVGPSAERPWIRDSIRAVRNFRLDRQPREPACGVFCVNPPHSVEQLPARMPFLHAENLDPFFDEVRDRPAAS